MSAPLIDRVRELFAAGGFRGAHVTDPDMLQDYLGSQIDFRQIYHEVIASRLCVDPTPVFPDFTHPGGSLNLFV